MPEQAVSAGLHLAERDLELVRTILPEHIPEGGVGVWIAGDGWADVEAVSDLDLAVDGELTWKQRAGLREAFEESLLPIKVDVVELGLVEAEFRGRIVGDFVVVQAG